MAHVLEFPSGARASVHRCGLFYLLSLVFFGTLAVLVKFTASVRRGGRLSAPDISVVSRFARNGSTTHGRKDGTIVRKNVIVFHLHGVPKKDFKVRGAAVAANHPRCRWIVSVGAVLRTLSQCNRCMHPRIVKIVSMLI